MQDGGLHAVQSRPHFLYRPNGALLRGLLGAVHGNRAFDKNAPPYGILEGCTQQPMNLVDGRAGKEPLLLLFSQFLLLSLDIRTAGCFAQGRVEVFHVVGLELLHLHAADIGNDKVLDGGEVGFVGFGCPFVLAALLGQPIHEELCRRHRGRDQESASRQFMFDLLLSVRCLLFGGKALVRCAFLRNHTTRFCTVILGIFAYCDCAILHSMRNLEQNTAGLGKSTADTFCELCVFQFEKKHVLCWKCCISNLLQDWKVDRVHKCTPVHLSSCSFEKALPDPAAECRAASLCGLGLCPAKSGHRADIAVRA